MTPATADIFPTVDELGRACAERIVQAAAHAIGERNVFTLVLSGGETPAGVYRLLGSSTFSAQIDWLRVHVLFTDERMVPPSDPQSNFGMVSRELLSRVPIPAQNVHRMPGEHEPRTAAKEYGATLKQALGNSGGVADFVLLGVGEDGHTASLFPGTPAVAEHNMTVCAVFVPRLESWRLTLTLPVLNAAREVRFLVSGKNKATIVKRVLGSTAPDSELPATLVRSGLERVRWMLDEEAGAEIR